MNDPRSPKLTTVPVKSSRPSHYYHGRLFRESPLFNNLSPTFFNGLKIELGDYILFSDNQFGRGISLYKKENENSEIFAGIEVLKPREHGPFENELVATFEIEVQLPEIKGIINITRIT